MVYITSNLLPVCYKLPVFLSFLALMPIFMLPKRVFAYNKFGM